MLPLVQEKRLQRLRLVQESDHNEFAGLTWPSLKRAWNEEGEWEVAAFQQSIRAALVCEKKANGAGLVWLQQRATSFESGLSGQKKMRLSLASRESQKWFEEAEVGR